MATSTTVTMGSAITEQALWEHDYYLTVSSANGAATGTGWYSAATSAFASVTPTTVAGSTGTQYVFTSWSGDASGTSSTSNAIIMNGPKAATANWKTQYYLTVSSANGTVGGSGWYDSGTSASSTLSSLTVAGTTGTQYVFTSWSGNAAGTSTPSNAITMDGPKTATANWQTQYNVTLTQSGVGSDFTNNFITVNGTTYNGNGYTTWANASDAYTFSYAPQLLVAANSKQCLLTGVTGNSSALSFVASAPTTVNGTYKTQYYLTTTTAYSSPSQANGWYDNGTSLSAFVASPVSTGSGTQYVCSGWSGDGSIPTSGSASALGFTITAPSTITWNWKTQYLVTFAVSPSGTGSTSPSGTNTWQDAGVISISGTPAYNYKFASWTSDSGSSIDNSLIGTTTATITGPTTITANFAVLPAATATPAPTHTATPTPTHTATPTPTASPTAKPTNASSPTSSPSNSTQNFNATPYIIGAVIAIIIVAILSSFMLLRKTRAKKGLS
jgi:cell division septation protein DedD